METKEKADVAMLRFLCNFTNGNIDKNFSIEQAETYMQNCSTQDAIDFTLKIKKIYLKLASQFWMKNYEFDEECYFGQYFGVLKIMINRPETESLSAWCKPHIETNIIDYITAKKTAYAIERRPLPKQILKYLIENATQQKILLYLKTFEAVDEQKDSEHEFYSYKYYRKLPQEIFGWIIEKENLPAFKMALQCRTEKKQYLDRRPYMTCPENFIKNFLFDNHVDWLEAVVKYQKEYIPKKIREAMAFHPNKRIRQMAF